MHLHSIGLGDYLYCVGSSLTGSSSSMGRDGVQVISYQLVDKIFFEFLTKGKVSRRSYFLSGVLGGFLGGWGNISGNLGRLLWLISVSSFGIVKGMVGAVYFITGPPLLFPDSSPWYLLLH
ncbi:hypothetical protein DSO57_1030207 [Entomophthora muscae]|uniref:Uncharacterized protein n=1 Tax=Entomophthora muscae TaxID=34485 RepID=A0ACC2RRW2_9FUNG|nr:hypothetical protein DSO57_1030207 [Entomophthora muscae]